MSTAAEIDSMMKVVFREGPPTTKRSEFTFPMGDLVECDPQNEYTDMKIVLDDGTTIKMHKMIICSVSKPIRAGITSCFKEGLSQEYRLPGKDPTTVCLLVDLIYGRKHFTPSNTLKDITRLQSQTALLTCCNLYGLADELQIDDFLKICARYVQVILERPECKGVLDLESVLLRLEEISGRPEAFLVSLLIGYFLQAPHRLDHDIQIPGGQKTSFMNYFKRNPQLRGSLARAICLVNGPPEIRHLGDIPSLDKACRRKDLVSAMISLYKPGETIAMAELVKCKGFVESLHNSGLASDIYVAILENPQPLCTITAKTNILRCSKCHAIYLIVDTYPDRCQFCRRGVLFKIVTALSVRDEVRKEVWRKINTRWI